ncbi:hypothetical protein C1I99_23665 [Micromonospora deserti]|uniref:Uncharacterized protein n=1 Tax=Micromonospora deserti TaxID=2070366 RepID=A0A2W2BVF5_9ACTN|nr:hypothetical protein C1I99_23665 [Micromonospora deserti]
MSELLARLGAVGALDYFVGVIKQRDRGLSRGQLLVSLAQAHMLGAGSSPIWIGCAPMRSPRRSRPRRCRRRRRRCGLHAGSPEEALDCACGLYLNDPTARPNPRRTNDEGHWGLPSKIHETRPSAHVEGAACGGSLGPDSVRFEDEEDEAEERRQDRLNVGARSERVGIEPPLFALAVDLGIPGGVAQFVGVGAGFSKAKLGR